MLDFGCVLIAVVVLAEVAIGVVSGRWDEEGMETTEEAGDSHCPDVGRFVNWYKWCGRWLAGMNANASYSLRKDAAPEEI